MRPGATRLRLLTAVSAGLLSAAWGLPAHARDNGKELLEQCSKALTLIEGDASTLSAADRNDAYFCLGFVQGVTNIVSISYYVKPRGQMFCPPPNATIPLDAAVHALVDYLKAHPERLSARKVTLAAAAFMKAYPCPYWPPVPDRRGARPAGRGQLPNR